MTFEKVMDYSNSIVLEPTGLFSFGGMFFILGIVLVISSLIYARLLILGARKQLIFAVTLAIITVLVVNSLNMILLSVPWVYAADGEEERYQKAATEWHVDYLVPYLESVSTTATDIKSIEYNTEIEAMRSAETYLDRKYNTPVRIQLKSGKTIEGWAVVEKANGQEETVSYSELEKTILFGQPRKAVYGNIMRESEAEREATFFNNVTRYKIEKGQYLINVKTDREFLSEG